MTALLAAPAAAAAVVVAGAALRPRRAGRPLPARPGGDGTATSARHRWWQWWWWCRPVPVAVAGAVLLLAITAGPLLAGAACGVALAVRPLRRRRAAARDRRSIETAMPDAIELLVACLHAGRSPSQAIAELGRLAPAPVRPAFAAVEQRLHRGHGLADALHELTSRCGVCALPLVNAMAAAVRDGLPLAPVLDRLTDEANAGRRRHGEAAARRLPVRLSFPLVVCTLPSFVLLSVAPAILGAVSSLRQSPL